MSAARIAGVPHRIAHSHNTSSLSRSKLFRLVYFYLARKLIKTNATRYIACGKAASDFLFGTNEDVTILPNAIDAEYFAFIGDTRTSYVSNLFELNEDTLKIIQVGRLESVKNPFFTIDIAKVLKERGLPFSIIFVGDGHLKRSLNEKILVDNLTEEVKLLRSSLRHSN